MNEKQGELLTGWLRARVHRAVFSADGLKHSGARPWSVELALNGAVEEEVAGLIESVLKADTPRICLPGVSEMNSPIYDTTDQVHAWREGWIHYDEVVRRLNGFNGPPIEPNAIILPRPLPTVGGLVFGDLRAEGWGDCLREVKRLNPNTKFAGG